MRSKFVVLAAVIALATFAFAANSALADKGGKGGKGRAVTSSSVAAQCSVTPSSVPLGTGYTVNGSGFGNFAGQEVAVRLETAAGTLLTGAVVSATGTWSVKLWAGAAGAYTVTVSTVSSGVLAACSFTVTS